MARARKGVEYVIICDNIRREDNGKQLLIGVYASDITVRKQPPINLPMLSFWIKLFPLAKGEYEFDFIFRSPSGKEIITSSGLLEIQEEDKPSSIPLPFYGIALPELGAYSVHCRIGDGGRLRKVAEIPLVLGGDVST